jgi:hypothetical protein
MVAHRYAVRALSGTHHSLHSSCSAKVRTCSAGWRGCRARRPATPAMLTWAPCKGRYNAAAQSCVRINHGQGRNIEHRNSDCSCVVLHLRLHERRKGTGPLELKDSADLQESDLTALDLRADRRMLSPTPALTSGLNGPSTSCARPPVGIGTGWAAAPAATLAGWL